ncbi:MAG TPA: sigma-70 family RNA polymerase sigma factor [Methylibium sp.]|uniref:sigma-70 family RNA polymerase sigma factor n=1 Tax=Methylibium sp. TaxID=2067992 RepID=UPI002DBCB411|nr:sigma-70 family RNA polymerase sigma factor [Methylibium sp.]HEU4459583.1 sigma-70 family RNA polymerase sigma factor [Methylibium sp.]
MPSRLETLFREHRQWLLDRVRRRTESVASAEDVVSETFLRVATYRSLDEVREPRALLTTLAKRVVFELWRRRDLERAYLEELATAEVATYPSPEERLSMVEALNAVETALDRLSPKARQAFLYCQLSDMTYAEIGERLNVSASMVRQYVAQAMAALVKVSEPEGPSS